MGTHVRRLYLGESVVTRILKGTNVHVSGMLMCPIKILSNIFLTAKGCTPYFVAEILKTVDLRKSKRKLFWEMLSHTKGYAIKRGETIKVEAPNVVGCTS